MKNKFIFSFLEPLLVARTLDDQQGLKELFPAHKQIFLNFAQFLSGTEHLSSKLSSIHAGLYGLTTGLSALSLITNHRRPIN